MQESNLIVSKQFCCQLTSYDIIKNLNSNKRFERFFDNDENKTIAAKDRCLLAYEVLSRTSFSRYLKEPAIFSGNENDPQIGIERLIAEEIFTAAYPLHEVSLLLLFYLALKVRLFLKI